ncbi:TonB-dependent receptor, partial [Acinetobacter baumannii]
GSSRGEAKRRDTGARGDVASVAPARGSLTLGYDAPSKRFGIAATTTHSKSKQAGPDIIAGVTTTRFDVKSYTIHDLSAYWNVSN